jgi:hypothetical protein
MRSFEVLFCLFLLLQGNSDSLTRGATFFRDDEKVKVPSTELVGESKVSSYKIEVFGADTALWQVSLITGDLWLARIGDLVDFCLLLLLLALFLLLLFQGSKLSLTRGARFGDLLFFFIEATFTLGRLTRTSVTVFLTIWGAKVDEVTEASSERFCFRIG